MNKRVFVACFSTFLFLLIMCLPGMAFASDLQPDDEAFIVSDEVEISEEEVPAGSFPLIGTDLGRNQGSRSRLSDRFWLAAVVIPFAVGIAGVGAYVGFNKMENEKNR